jgi:hypothetical protein
MDLNAYLRRLEHLEAPDEALIRWLWDYQRSCNPVLREYAERLGVEGPVSLPVAFFKHFPLQSGVWEPELAFESSGTTGQTPSRHLIRDAQLYARTTLQGFFRFFPRHPRRILALLPSYLERGQSSLVQMVKDWMDAFGLPGSGFYLYNTELLRQSVAEAADAGEPVLLIGVAYALLDLVEERAMPLPPGAMVLETGGMKGRREELTREELHARLRAGLGVAHVYSEYGMTELMSQAYLLPGGRFHPAPTMRIRISDIHLDRLDQPPGITGRIHVTDLANVHSCAFIATDDLGRLYPDGSFDVLGRLDTAELRGCNLMYV